jgi:hypothetical protein
MPMYAACLAYNRRHRFRVLAHAIALDHFVQAAAVISVSAIPFACFAQPDLAGVASVILAVTGLVTVLGGILKVRTEQEQKRCEWEYDHPPRDPQSNHRPMPDSDVAEDDHDHAAMPHPDHDDAKVKRVRRRRKEKHDDPPHGEATSP